MNFRKSVLMLAALCVLPAVGCRRNSNDSATGNLSKRNVVIWHNLSDIERLNPYTSTDANASYIQQKIWEPLNFQNPRTLELIPGLASLPEISEDHLTYTYTMNPAAHWSDGQPLTSADVIFSFKTVVNPKIINLQQLRNYFQSLDSVYNPDGDKSKVAFRLNKPYFQADVVLGGGYVLILPKHTFDPNNLTDKMSWKELKNATTNDPSIKEFATWFESPELAREPKYQIGSGAYIFKEWITHDRITLKRDTNYWARDMQWLEAYPDELIWKTINDQNAALTALKAKDIDLIEQLKPEQYDGLDIKKSPHLRKDSVYWNGYTYIGWNNKRPLFRDKMVRKALTAAIDRDLILKTLYKNNAKKVESGIIFTQPNWDPNVKQIGYSLDTAKALLARAGWKDSDGDGILDKVIDGKLTPFKFTFQVNSGNDTRKQILLIVAEQLRKIGIEASVSAIEWSVYLENTKGQNYDACYSAWAGNASEDEVYQLWHSSQSKNKGSNFYSFVNAEADKIMEDTRTEFDKAKRFAMASRLQQIMVEEQPVTFMFAVPLFIGMVDRFDNVEFFRQRPCFDVRYWVVRGANVQRRPNAIAMGSN